MKRFASTIVFVLAIFRGAENPGFVPLFDGESLAGWTSIGSKTGNWRSEDGLLVTRGDGKGWLSTNRAYSDFEMELEYRIGPGGNSGVLIRAPHKGDPSFDGIEIQILDDDAPVYRKLKPEQYTGSVYGVIAAQRGKTRPPGEWNAMRIRVEGSRIFVELNGSKILDGDLSNHPEVLPRHSGIQRKLGFIGLQSHESPVQFRKLAIKEIRRASHEEEARPTSTKPSGPGD